jgi:GT2 family glycosyltransferase
MGQFSKRTHISSNNINVEKLENRLTLELTPTLSVVVGTYNRLHLLRQCLEALAGKINIAHEIVVIDAGSTDGTIDYLKEFPNIRLICDGERLGQARSYNRVFKTITSKYTCWLSDDNVVRDGMLDLAVSVLEENQDIGMVALKTKDVIGPFRDADYIGGISSVGILNCNQGVIRSDVLRDVGYFSEEFRDYGIDADLTAKVLLKGWAVVYTRKLAIEHYREWMGNTDSEDYQMRMERQQRSLQLYHERYRALAKFSISLALKRVIFQIIRLSARQAGRMKALAGIFNLKIRSFFERCRYIVQSQVNDRDSVSHHKFVFARFMGFIEALIPGRLADYLKNNFQTRSRDSGSRQGTYLNSYSLRDWQNVFQGRYISILDLYKNRSKPFYLVQYIKKINS